MTSLFLAEAAARIAENLKNKTAYQIGSNIPPPPPPEPRSRRRGN